MTVSRSARVWGLVAADAAGRGREMSAADACVAAVEAVEVTGAWLSAADGAEMGHLLRVTDEVSEQLAELQLTLGEGPCSDAAAVGGPGWGSGSVRLPAADRGHPGRGHGHVPGPPGLTERLPAR